MSVEIKPATITDVYNVLSRSTVAKVPKAKEIMRGRFYASEETWAGFIDGRLICVFGVTRYSVIADHVSLWLLTVECIETPFTFVRAAQMQVDKLLKSYSRVVGHVAANSETSQRWLRLIGFKIKKNDQPFYDIERSA